MMDEKEHKEFMLAYMEHYAAGKCINKSDYMRQALLAFRDNKQESIQDNIPDNKQEGEQQPSNPFANIDI